MAVPKRKVSKARRDRRRTAQERLDMPGLVACPKCGELVRPHHVCKNCGTYDGEEVIKLEEEKKN